jgi:phospholipase/carboxylesterase
VDELHLPQSLPVRFSFPHARQRPVTINNGFVMRAWYDIKGLGRDGPEDDAGIRESAEVVRDYIAAEVARGIRSTRIVIAGFSQGGAIALHLSVRHMVPLPMGEWSRDFLTQLGYRVDWRTYPMQHSVCLEEVNDISRWLQDRLG